MGDRAWTRIVFVVPNGPDETIQRIARAVSESMISDIQNGGERHVNGRVAIFPGDLFIGTGEEVNYAEFNELESELRSLDIEYDKFWSAGSTFSAGAMYRRLDEGRWRDLEVEQCECGVVVIHAELLWDIMDRTERGNIGWQESYQAVRNVLITSAPRVEEIEDAFEKEHGASSSEILLDTDSKEAYDHKKEHNERAVTEED